jgi:hypothetical protein
MASIDVIHNDGRRWAWCLGTSGPTQFDDMAAAEKRARRLNRLAAEKGVDFRYEAVEKAAPTYSEQWSHDGSPRTKRNV